MRAARRPPTSKAWCRPNPASSKVPCGTKRPPALPSTSGLSLSQTDAPTSRPRASSIAARAATIAGACRLARASASLKVMVFSSAASASGHPRKAAAHSAATERFIVVLVFVRNGDRQAGECLRCHRRGVRSEPLDEDALGHVEDLSRLRRCGCLRVGDGHRLIERRPQRCAGGPCEDEARW
jgi:hypothetical protein